MNSPHEFDILLSYVQGERAREAAADRLARQVPRSRAGLRHRMAAGLHALANRLDTQCLVEPTAPRSVQSLSS